MSWKVWNIMALAHSPSIVTQGLVLAYDINNLSKSYKGKPAVNLTHPTTMTNEGGIGPYYGGVISANNFERGAKSFKITTASNAQYDGGIALNGGNLTNGTTYTWSMDVWVPAGRTVQGRMRQITGGGWLGGSTVDISGTDSWQRVSKTFTADTNTSGSIECAQSAGGTADVFSFWVKDLMLETGSLASPFVQGTRTNQQSVIDLTGKKTITANSLTYNGDNTFRFDRASSNFMALDSSIDCYNKSYTLEAWIKRDSMGAAHGILSDSQFGWFYFCVGTSDKLFLQHGYYNPGETRNNVTGSTNILNNTWYHVVSTFEMGVGMKLYVNGVLDGSNSNPAAFALNDPLRGPYYIGRAETSTFGTTPNFFNGTIANLKGYSGKALTQAEVLQNFNALRGKYGV